MKKLKLIDSENFMYMVILGTLNSISLQDKYPDKIISFAYLDPENMDLDALRDDLDAGAQGIGELIIRHFATKNMSISKNEWVEHGSMVKLIKQKPISDFF